MTDFIINSSIDAGQDDVQGFADLGVWGVFLGVGTAIGYFGVKSTQGGSGDYFYQEALATARAGAAMSNAVRPR